MSRPLSEAILRELSLRPMTIADLEDAGIGRHPDPYATLLLLEANGLVTYSDATALWSLSATADPRAIRSPAPAPDTAPEPSAVVDSGRYWYTDLEGGFHLVDSADEARGYAARELDGAEDGACDDGWPDGVTGIRWGSVLGEVRETESGVDDRGCKLCCGPVDSFGRCVDPLCAEVTPIEEWVRYGLVDVARPPLPPVAPGAPELVRRLLEPQPPPVGGGPSVTDAALRLVDDERIQALLLARREQGRARYGRELTASNGRDALADAAQEATDLLLYLVQLQMEGRGLILWPLAKVLRQVVDAAEGEAGLRDGTRP